MALFGQKPAVARPTDAGPRSDVFDKLRSLEPLQVLARRLTRDADPPS
jgi:hypothetical protein